MTWANRTLSSGQRRQLQRQLHTAHDARLYRQTLALLLVSEGRPLVEVSRHLRMGRVSLYRWMERYHASGSPGVLADLPRPGRPSRWTEALRAELLRALEQSPDELGYWPRHWTVPLLQGPLERQSGERLSRQTLHRELQRLGWVWKRAKYELIPDPQGEKKTPYPLAGVPLGPRHGTVGRR